MKAQISQSLRFGSALRASLLILVLCAGAALAQTEQTDWAAEGQAWWAHIQYLASDDLQGRDTGSEGYQQSGGLCSKAICRRGFATGRHKRFYAADGS